MSLPIDVQEGFEEALVVPLARMVYGEVGHTYLALARPEGAALVGKLVNTLRFTVKEIDPSTGKSTAFQLCVVCLARFIFQKACAWAPFFKPIYHCVVTASTLPVHQDVPTLTLPAVCYTMFRTVS